MADVKFTGLAAGSGIPDNGSIMAISTYDGVSTYTSEKYTMTQLKDIVYVMEAEDEITFDSSGTNKIFASNGTAALAFNSGVVTISSDGNTLAEGWVEGAPTYSILAFGGSDWVNVDASQIDITKNNVELLVANNTGLGFFGATPVAKPTGVAVTIGAVHAALVSLGLIGV